MTRRDANQLMVCERCLDKDFRYRLPILGEIVIAERTGRVGVIEIYELPVRWLCCVGIVQLQGIAPNRQEVLVVAFLQSGRQLVEGDTESDCRLIDAGDGNRAALACLGRVNEIHGILRLLKNLLRAKDNTESNNTLRMYRYPCNFRLLKPKHRLTRGG